MILYLDVETTTAPEVLLQGLAEAGLAAQGTDWRIHPAAVEWVAEHAGDHALDPLRGRAVCVGIAVDDAEPRVRSGPEIEVLQRLLAAIEHVQPERIVAHYGHSFDFPFLRARSLALGLPALARELWQDKPWEGRLVDTSEPSWAPRPARPSKGWGYSLDWLAELLSIPRATGGLTGAGVPAAWYRGEVAAVEARCLDDVRVLREVHRRIGEGRR